MRYAFQLVGFACAAVAALAGGPANAEKRVALVIGNAGYKAVAELPNPRKDARDVAAALKAALFAEVVERYDLGVQEMRDALAAFEDKATGADWAVVYYAGHGIEVDGRNYLVPVDAQLKRATDVEDETLPLERVLARVATAGKLQLVILDACRFNPFRQRMAGTATRLIGERGLARVEPAHPNVIVAYAARDGQAALDGKPGDNSPYARALLKYLAEPGLELGNLFRKVRDEVLAETGGKQRPYEYGSLTGQQLFFKPGAAADPKPAVLPLPQPSAAAIEWARVDKSSVAELETFERRHPASVEAEYARARLKELQKVAIVTPPPPPVVAPPKAVEPAVSVFTPGPDVTPLTPDRERALKRGDTFKECDVCPEMVVVPAGSFMMGSPPTEIAVLTKGGLTNARTEGPQRRVTIARAFAVGKFEVTFAEWDACVAAGGCKHQPSDAGWGRGRRPVINVSWKDITEEYLPWLSRKADTTYRLLTEAEWEYAARAGTATRYHFGNAENELCAYGNIADQSYKLKYRDSTAIANCRDGHVNTAPVGSFQPNAFGLYDMIGNVWEWVNDCWNGNYKGAPADGSAWTMGDCGRRVGRSSSWSSSPEYHRSANRFLEHTGSRGMYGGFRVARTL